MALTAPLKVSEQANIILSAMQGYFPAGEGVAVIAFSIYDFWKQAAMSSQKVRIIICYDGDSSRGDFAHGNAWHRVDRNWLIGVFRGRGTTPNRGDTLSQTVGNMEPFYDVVEDIRDLFRSILNISEELPTVDYRGTKPAQLGNLVYDGFIISGSCASDIPMILTQPDDSNQ